MTGATSHYFPSLLPRTVPLAFPLPLLDFRMHPCPLLPLGYWGSVLIFTGRHFF
ncbi:hypothetical protein C1646_699464 [Rhizophagus diaphanus]|nr:hypothetical protein C1646_699464 [Rhizophagus diaphanus] [Rhizophagus sp. MUCL 43196]